MMLPRLLEGGDSLARCESKKRFTIPASEALIRASHGIHKVSPYRFTVRGCVLHKYSLCCDEGSVLQSRRQPTRLIRPVRLGCVIAVGLDQHYLRDLSRDNLHPLEIALPPFGWKSPNPSMYLDSRAVFHLRSL